MIFSEKPVSTFRDDALTCGRWRRTRQLMGVKVQSKRIGEDRRDGFRIRTSRNGEIFTKQLCLRDRDPHKSVVHVVIPLKGRFAVLRRRRNISRGAVRVMKKVEV